MANIVQIRTQSTETSVESAARVLRSRFDAFVEQMPRALEAGNADGVHDMRIAVRRFLTALRDLAPLFADGRSKALRREVKVLADTLGSVRDHDVAIIELQKLRANNTNEAIDEGLRSFIEARTRRRTEAFADLQEVLNEARISEVRKRLSKFASRPRDDSSDVDGRSFTDVGREKIRERLDAFLKDIRYIYDPFDTGALHKLRLETKRLRYAMQLFTDPEDASDQHLIAEIGELQACLGDMHDCDVWIMRLARSLRRRFKSGDISGNDYAAAEWLLGEFVKKRSRSYRDALGLWNTWRNNDFLTRMAECTGAALPPTNAS